MSAPTHRLPRRLVALVALAALAAAVVLSACSEVIGVRGSGDLVTETVDAEDFDSVEVHRAFQVDVTVEPGSATSVTVTIDDNLVEYLDIDVSAGVLIVDATRNLRPTGDARVEITVPALEAIDASGASRVRVTGAMEARRVRVDVSGASTATLDEVNADDLDLFASGASRIEVAGGEVDRVIVDASGASNVRTEEVPARRVDVDVSGASTAHVRGTDTVRGSASGASTVNVYGSPGTVDVDTSGASSVRERD